MISLQKINTKILSRQRGVSIIELIVAMALGLFLLFALVEILINGKQSFGAANNLSRLQEDGRVAINLLVSDLKRTGYMGGNSDVPKISGTTPPQAPNAGCPTATTNWGLMITQPIFGLDDTRTGYDCIPATAYLRGDILVVRHAAPWVETGALIGTRIYLRSSLFDGKTFLGSAQANVINNVPDTPSNVREMLAHAYFVGPSGRSCGGAAVPSLFRARLDDNGRPVSEELLPGIEHFQVQFGINDQYLDADMIALADWPNVVTARIWLLVRSECSETGFTDNATYIMGDTNYIPNDSFRRQLYSSVVMIRNQI